jgi:hypothetical protein
LVAAFGSVIYTVPSKDSRTNVPHIYALPAKIKNKDLSLEAGIEVRGRRRAAKTRRRPQRAALQCHDQPMRAASSRI